MISAKIIADSVSEYGKRVTTMQLRYPRFIHAEFMTHRVFSRNAGSSRAKPTAKLIEEVRNEPAMPVSWGLNQKGMQAGEELSHKDKLYAIDRWRSAAESAATHAERLLAWNVHKQVVNRILEPFLHIDVVVTATEWANFFALRRHHMAQPEIHALADAMFEAMEASEPVPLLHDQWHLPYVQTVWNGGTSNDGDRIVIDPTKHDGYRVVVGSADDPEWIEVDVSTAIKVSVARCARVSYKVLGEDRYPSLEDDLALYERLVGAHPIHASAAEHQARPDEAYNRGFNVEWEQPKLHGNFVGWVQYRKLLAGEFYPG